MSKLVKEPDDQYHAVRDRLSSSGIREILRSPMHFKAKYIDEQEDKSTDAKRLGTILHSAILEPQDYLTRLMVQPKFDRRTTVGKQGYAKFISDLPDKAILVKEDELEIVKGVVDSIRSHPMGSQVLANGQAEMSAYWEEDRGVPIKCKARLDFIREDGLIVDLKSTRDASYQGFQRSIYNYGYHAQAAWYMRAAKVVTGKEPPGYLFLAFESSPPYACALYLADPTVIEMGEHWVERGMGRYVECLRKDSWPGYSTDVVPIAMPSWAINREEYGDE